MRCKIFLTNFLCAAIFLPLSVMAAEIRIVDANGLTRAVRAVEGGGNVTLHLANEGKSGGTLVHTDGLASDISGVARGTEVVFLKVRNGTWRIEGVSETIREVDIVPEHE